MPEDSIKKEGPLDQNTVTNIWINGIDVSVLLDVTLNLTERKM